MKARWYALLALVALTPATLLGQAEDRMIPSYKTSTPPAIDGVISAGEWDAAGPPIIVNQNSPNVGLGSDIAEDIYGGDEDLSYTFRTMWAEPWTVYFLVEITDDIAMEDDPRNLWERDQVELFFDGDNLTGSDDLPSYEWWNPGREPFGKFGTSRNTTFEGNPGRMTDDEGSTFVDDEFTYVNVATVASETGENGNFLVEYSVSIEPMYLLGTFDDDAITTAAASIVEGNTVIKSQIALSDDDNFDSGTTERSHTLAYLGLSDWRNTSEFADLTFLGPYSPGVDGDFDGSGQLDAPDIDDLTTQSAGGTNPAAYDLNSDALVNDGDVNVWIKDLFDSWVGDADLSGEFNSSDLVQVLASGTYEADVPAVWSSGDFNGDGRTDSSDLVAALADGGYEAGPRAAVAAVPEPTGLLLIALGFAVMCVRRRVV